MARDCVSLTGGDPPSSKIDSAFSPCGRAWCWNQKVAPGPIEKLDRFPPSRQTTFPLGRAIL